MRTLGELSLHEKQLSNPTARQRSYFDAFKREIKAAQARLKSTGLVVVGIDGGAWNLNPLDDAFLLS